MSTTSATVATASLLKLIETAQALPRLNSPSAREGKWDEETQNARHRVYAALNALRGNARYAFHVTGYPMVKNHAGGKDFLWYEPDAKVVVTGFWNEYRNAPDVRRMSVGKWVRKHARLMAKTVYGESYDAVIEALAGESDPTDDLVAQVSQWLGQAAQKMNAAGGDGFSSTVVWGKEAAEVYSQYPHAGYEGLSSCMTGTYSRYITPFLNNNADVVGVWRCTLDEPDYHPQSGRYPLAGVLAGRCLVWKSEEGFTFDKLYAKREYRKDVEAALARYKRDMEQKEVSRSQFTVYMEDDDDWPYLDTFRYVTIEDEGSYLLCSYDDGGCDYQATATDGEGPHGGGGGELCCSCECRIYDGEGNSPANSGEVYCDDCIGDDHTYLQYRNPNSYWREGYYPDDECYECAVTGVTMHVDDMTYVDCGIHAGEHANSRKIVTTWSGDATTDDEVGQPEDDAYYAYLMEDLVVIYCEEEQRNRTVCDGGDLHGEIEERNERLLAQRQAQIELDLSA